MTRIEALACPGLAGPDSVAWKINSEIALLLGWGRAILMQFAHPLVAAGVAEHSLFLREPTGRMRRLRHTLSAMLALTFGTGEEVARAGAGINAIHDRVHGRLRDGTPAFPIGTHYSAHDPRLLTWVHATLLDSYFRVYELYVRPLTRVEKDGYCAEATGMGPVLGVPDGYLPANLADLDAYLSAMLASGEIAVTETARRLAERVVWPPAPWAMRPILGLMRLPTIGLLPPALREAYGFTWDARSEAALHRSARLVRGVLPLVPPVARYWPAARAAGRRATGAKQSNGDVSLRTSRGGREVDASKTVRSPEPALSRRVEEAVEDVDYRCAGPHLGAGPARPTLAERGSDDTAPPAWL